MPPDERVADEDKQSGPFGIAEAFSQLCEIAGYYAQTIPDQLDEDFFEDIEYLQNWPRHASQISKKLDKVSVKEFRRLTDMIDPLVDQLWEGLNNALVYDPIENRERFIKHIGAARRASWKLIKALNCS